MYVSILGSCTSPVFHTIMELCDTYFTVFVSTFTLMGIYVRVCVCVCVELNFILIILIMYLGVSLVFFIYFCDWLCSCTQVYAVPLSECIRTVT